jgi:hypothetical protein
MTSRTPNSLFFLITFIAGKSLELFFFVLLSLACRHDDYGCDVGGLMGQWMVDTRKMGKSKEEVRSQAQGKGGRPKLTQRRKQGLRTRQG